MSDIRETLKEEFTKAMQSVADQSKKFQKERGAIVAKAIREALGYSASASYKMLLGIAEMLEEE